nr:thiol reductant ABC exporter subunit CydC [Kibdelosporangium sp. MJ126-NF4]CEL19949.1 Transport ATP-binding protein CydC [Kibdelosporangium sp. MJ126-NF4]CTQ97173.1 Transport ATP-binding protein CydC [Kibdelosporangium sp. MJ126-NF4]
MTGTGPALRLGAGAVAAVLCEASAVALTGFATWLICRASEQPQLGALAIAVVTVRALAIGRGVLRYGERLSGHDATLRIMTRVRGRVFDALVPRAPFGLAAFRRGDLLTRLVSDVDTIQDLLLRVLLPATAAVGVGALATGYTVSVVSDAGIVMAVGLVIAIGVLPPLAALLSERSGRRLVAAKASLSVKIVDLLDGFEDLIVLDAVDEALERQQSSAQRVATLERRRGIARAVLAAAGVAVHLGTAVVVALVGMAAAGRGEVSPIDVAVVTLMCLAVFEVAQPLHLAAEQFGAMRAGLARVREILQPVSEKEADGHVEPAAELDIVDAGYTYPGAGRPALTGMNLSLRPGRTTALVGPSGSGKSTALALALGLLAPDTGQVRLAGRDIGDIAPHQLRPGLITGLTQYAYLFTGTIRANMELGSQSATEDQMWQALADAGASDWVRDLPDGLDTVIGSDGMTVSGGQRQRLALAVVLLAAPAVLVLDEPTESLDTLTADRVMADLMDATNSRTVLLTSHRLCGLEAVDEIVVLSGGYVVQRGSHERLLAEPGYYRERYLGERAALDLFERIGGRNP